MDLFLNMYLVCCIVSGTVSNILTQKSEIKDACDNTRVLKQPKPLTWFHCLRTVNLKYFSGTP